VYIAGLVSVTFRTLPAKDVLALCNRAGLEAIEWGGDAHVPPRDIKNAREVARMSADAGVEICSYGSYYKIGQPLSELEMCLDTANELGAPVLRVWAGRKGSRKCSEDERKYLTECLRQADAMARKRNIALATEFHPNTLTDNLDSIRALRTELPDLRMYWQPRWDWPEEERLTGLALVGDALAHMHIFSWRHENGNVVRLPLEREVNFWKRVFSRRRERCCALLEFVENDDREALLRDAAALRGWVSEQKV